MLESYNRFRSASVGKCNGKFLSEAYKAVSSVVPMMKWLPNYDTNNLYFDVFAGVVITVMTVPNGMAYSVLAGLPPAYGLYACAVPKIIYGILGTGKQLSYGPVAVVSLLIHAILQKSDFAQESEGNYIDAAFAMSFLVGIIMFVMGFMRLGVLANLVSHSVLSGFISATAVVIIASQIRFILGLDLPFEEGLHTVVYDVFSHIEETNPDAIIVSIVGFCILIPLKLVLICSKKISSAMDASSLYSDITNPQERTKYIQRALTVLLTFCRMGTLFVVVITALTARSIILRGGDLKIVGHIDGGMRTPRFPSLVNKDTGNLVVPFADCFLLAIINFLESYAVAQVYAFKHGYEIYPSQEMIGVGAANIAGSIFGTFTTGISVTASPILDQSGARTQLAGAIGGVMMILSIFTITSSFYYIPMAGLAVIVIMAVSSLIEFHEFSHAYRVSKRDFVSMVVTFFITLFVGVEEGLFGGIICSILLVLQRSIFPKIEQLDQYAKGHFVAKSVDSTRMSAMLSFENFEALGNVPATNDGDQEHQLPGLDCKKYNNFGIAVVRMDANLYFANCNNFKANVMQIMFPEDVVSHLSAPPEVLVLDCNYWIDIDVGSAHFISGLVEALHEAKKEVLFANLSPLTRKRLKLGGALECVKDDCICPSLPNATRVARGIVRFNGRQRSVSGEAGLTRRKFSSDAELENSPFDDDEDEDDRLSDVDVEPTRSKMSVALKQVKL